MSGLVLFAVTVATLAGIYALWTMVLNMEAGWAGMWDLGVAGLLGFGGYAFVVLTQTQNTTMVFAPGLPMWAGIVLSALLTGLVAFVIGLPALRTRGIQFLIATLAFAEVIHQLAISEVWLTNGTLGFSQFDRPLVSLAGGTNYRFVLLGLVWITVVIVFLLMMRLARAPFIRVVRGFRDNDPVALSLGKHTNRHRLLVYTLAGVLYGATVPLYLWYLNSLNPKIFISEVTFTVWGALVIGGIASKKGPVVGAIILIAVTEATGLVQGSSEFAALIASSRWVILGLLLLLVMRFMPEGLLKERNAFARASAHLPEGPPVVEAAGSAPNGTPS